MTLEIVEKTLAMRDDKSKQFCKQQKLKFNDDPYTSNSLLLVTL